MIHSPIKDDFSDVADPRDENKLPHDIPSHDTFNRVFAALNPENFNDSPEKR